MERNIKKITLIFENDKREINEIPQNFEDLKNSFFEAFLVMPSNKYTFCFKEKGDEDYFIIDESKEEYQKKMNEILEQENSEIYVKIDIPQNSSKSNEFNDTNSCGEKNYSLNSKKNKNEFNINEGKANSLEFNRQSGKKEKSPKLEKSYSSGLSKKLNISSDSNLVKSQYFINNKEVSRIEYIINKGQTKSFDFSEGGSGSFKNEQSDSTDKEIKENPKLGRVFSKKAEKEEKTNEFEVKIKNMNEELNKIKDENKNLLENKEKDEINKEQKKENEEQNKKIVETKEAVNEYEKKIIFCLRK